MLSLWLGEHKDIMYNVDGYFNAWFDKENMLTDYARYAAKHIDGCTVVDRLLITHEVYGAISPDSLSGTCKAVLLAKFNPEVVINFAQVGEKGYQILADLVKNNDILMCTTMWIGDFFAQTGIKEIKIANYKGGVVVHSNLEYVQLMCEFEKGGGKLVDR